MSLSTASSPPAWKRAPSADHPEPDRASPTSATPAALRPFGGTRRITLLALAAASLALACGTAGAAGLDAFPAYESVAEVPIVGHFAPKHSRHGPPPTRAWVRTTSHSLRAMGASRVRCHGVPGELVACLIRIPERVRARTLVRPSDREKEFIVSCQTLSGSLTTGPCFDFTVWEFNWTEQGPGPLPVR